MTHDAFLLVLPDETTIVITETLLQSELRCIAVAVKLMSFGYFRIHPRIHSSIISRIDKDDWATYVKGKAHIFRLLHSRDTLSIPGAIIRHIRDSRDVPGRYE